MRDAPFYDLPFIGSSWGTKLLRKDIRKKWIISWEEGMKDNLMWANRMARDHGFWSLNRRSPDTTFLKQ